MNTSTKNPTKMERPNERRVIEPVRRIASPSEKAGFNSIIAENQKAKTETEMDYPGGRANDGGNADQVKRIVQSQSQTDIDSLTPAQKEKLEKRLKELNAWMRPRMIPRNCMGLKRLDENGQPNERFVKARDFMARAGNEASVEFNRVAEERKMICRALGRPHEGNTETIRPRDGRDV